MATYADLIKDIDFVHTLGDFIQVSEQVSVVKMQYTRRSVVGTRRYMEGLLDIFSELKQAQWITKRSSENQKSFWQEKRIGIQTKDKELVVLLSTSSKFSGEVNHKVFNLFRKYINQHADSEYDVLIIGKIGKETWENTFPNKPYTFLDIAEEDLSNIEMSKLVSSIVPYPKITFFFGKFINLMKQIETSASIADFPVKKELEDGKVPVLKYLFEPSLEFLLKYFEEQLFSSLIKQTRHEGFLAHLGSRVTALELATSKVEKRISQLGLEKRRLLKRQRNRKQLQQLAGMSLWKVKI